jgi:hypothetical protein
VILRFGDFRSWYHFIIGSKKKIPKCRHRHHHANSLPKSSPLKTSLFSFFRQRQTMQVNSERFHKEIACDILDVDCDFYEGFEIYDFSLKILDSRRIDLWIVTPPSFKVSWKVPLGLSCASFLSVIDVYFKKLIPPLWLLCFRDLWLGAIWNVNMAPAV